MHKLRAFALRLLGIRRSNDDFTAQLESHTFGRFKNCFNKRHGIVFKAQENPLAGGLLVRLICRVGQRSPME
jgi:hypothetical protein